MPHRAIFAKPMPFAHKVLGLFVYMAICGIILFHSINPPNWDKPNFMRSHPVQHPVGSCHTVLQPNQYEPPPSVETWLKVHSLECHVHREGALLGLGAYNSLSHFAVTECFAQQPVFCVQFTRLHPYLGPTCTDHQFPCHAILAPSWRSYTCMQRLGEADNPGPAAEAFRIAITNPTSIYSKSSTYQELQSEHQLDIITASETSATQIAQSSFSNAIRSTYRRTLWSVPVPDHRPKTDGTASKRGKAAGVACMTNHRIRHAQGTLTPEWEATSRILHVVLTLGKLDIQMLIIYALPTTQNGSTTFNSDLLGAAIQASNMLPLPCIILGDFNGDPYSWQSGSNLKQQGFWDLRAIHQRLTGQPMPPTCRGVTTPDNALFSPNAASWVSRVQVIQDEIFDCHKVVTFDLMIPEEDAFVQSYRIPETFLKLPMHEADLHEAYSMVTQQCGQPLDLTTWGQQLEMAVDHAYRKFQVKEEGYQWTETKGMPKRYRGRCQPTQIVQHPVRSHFKVGRPGDYKPPMEIHTYQTQAKVKQLRRIHALLFLLRKKDWAEPQHSQAWGLWHAILRCKAFHGSFTKWAQHIPEIGPLPVSLPNPAFLDTILQIAKHETNQSLWNDRQKWKDKMEFRRRLDFRCQGNARAFARIRDPTQPGVFEIRTHAHDTAIPIPQEDGTLLAYCHEPGQFHNDAIIQIHDTHATLLDKNEHSLLLSIHGALPDMEQCEIEQQRVITHPTEIMQQLQDHWSQYWTVNPEKLEPPPGFNNMLTQLQPLLQDQSINFADPQEWYQAVHSLNAKSARGIDGISAAELQCLPNLAIDHLKDILLQFQEFPPWLMIAKTTPVPKVDQPRIHEYRPITVLAQSYRLWSKVITRVLIRTLATRMPKEVTGFLPGRGPADATYNQQFLLEWAHTSNFCLSGFALDLKRCFNTIGRKGAALIMKAIGVPHQVIQVWQASLANLTRTWTVQGLSSLPCHTNNGLPEGDPMSVTAMLAIAYAWTQQVQKHTSDLHPTAFADNWGWCTTDASQHAPALQVTKQMADFLNMIVDWKKSWLWSSHKQHLPELKAAVKREAPQEHVPELLSAMDLGAQLTYRGNARLGKLRDRLSKARTRLQRLEQQQEPLFSKARLITSGIYPVAMYGMELTPVGSQHIDSLRTAVASALLGPSVSRNSALAIHCTPNVQDPQVVLMQRTLMAARRFLYRATPEEQIRFFQLVSRHTGLSYDCKGPAGVLKYRLDKFGWQLNPQGLLIVSAFVQVPILDIGQSTLLRLCQMQWQEQIMQHTDRKALRGLPPICRLSTIQVLRKFQPPQQVKLLNEIAGAFQTRAQQAAWDDQINPCCPHCGELDTREHRALTCTALHDLRSQFEETFSWIHNTGSAIGDLPVVFCHEARECLMTVQWHQVDPEISPNLHSQLQVRDQGGQTITLFTDGSCFHPNLPEFRYAAFAVVLDCAESDEERAHQALQYQRNGTMPPSLKTLTAARLPGLQDIHRAELYAIVTIIERYCNTEVYTDSSTTLSLLQHVANAKEAVEMATSPHYDLLLRLWKAWHLGQRRFHKVKAHSEKMTGLTPLQLYIHLGNKAANDSAIHACATLLPNVVSTLEEACTDQLEQQKHLKHMFDFQLLAQKRMAQLQLEKQREDNLTPVVLNKWDMLRNYTIDQPWAPPIIQLNWTMHTAWGPYVGQKMLTWMQNCRWPQQALHTEAAEVGVSWYELVLSFMQHAKMFLPLRRKDRSGREFLIPFRNKQEVAAHRVRFSEFANTFSIYFLQFTGRISEDIWPGFDRKLVKSLFVQGAQIYTSGFSQRPSFPFQDWVFDTLKPYLRDNPGQAITVMPDVEWTVDEQLYKRLQTDLRGDWKTRTMSTRRKMKQMRTWREKPMERIQFGPN